ISFGDEMTRVVRAQAREMHARPAVAIVAIAFSLKAEAANIHADMATAFHIMAVAAGGGLFARGRRRRRLMLARTALVDVVVDLVVVVARRIHRNPRRADRDAMIVVARVGR